MPRGRAARHRARRRAVAASLKRRGPGLAVRMALRGVKVVKLLAGKVGCVVPVSRLKRPDAGITAYSRGRVSMGSRAGAVRGRTTCLHLFSFAQVARVREPTRERPRAAAQRFTPGALERSVPIECASGIGLKACAERSRLVGNAATRLSPAIPPSCREARRITRKRAPGRTLPETNIPVDLENKVR